MLRLIFAVLLLSACGSPRDGPVGPTGKDGTNGKDGAPGSTFGVQQWTVCAHVDSTVGINVYYSTTMFTDGARYVDCAIHGPSIGSTNNAFYSSTQQGATYGFCEVFFDIDAASYGQWEFNLLPSPRASYLDTPSASNGLSEVFVGTDCTSGQ